MPQIRITKEYLRYQFMLVVTLILVAAGIGHQMSRNTFKDVMGKVEAVTIFDELLTVLIEANINLENYENIENSLASDPGRSKIGRSVEALENVVAKLETKLSDGSLDGQAAAIIDNPTLDLFGVLNDLQLIMQNLATAGSPWGHQAEAYVDLAQTSTDQILPVIKRLSNVELEVLDRANKRMLVVNNIIMAAIFILIVIIGVFIYAPLERRVLDSHEEIRAKQKQAEAASVAKSQFLANMSHEIRTPMNGVLGMAEVLETTALDASQRDMLKVITDSGKSLMSIIEDILDFSKIGANKMVLDPAPFNFRALTEHLYKLFTPMAQKTGLTFIWEDDEKVANVLIGDKLRILQILTNLIGNAIKFTENGKVSLFLSKQIRSIMALKISPYRLEIRVSELPRIRLNAFFSNLSRPIHHRHENSAARVLGWRSARRLPIKWVARFR